MLLILPRLCTLTALITEDKAHVSGLVAVCVEQHAQGVLAVATSTPCLLVVALHRFWNGVMEYKPDIERNRTKA